MTMPNYKYSHRTINLTAHVELIGKDTLTAAPNVRSLLWTLTKYSLASVRSCCTDGDVITMDIERSRGTISAQSLERRVAIYREGQFDWLRWSEIEGDRQTEILTMKADFEQRFQEMHGTNKLINIL